MLNVKKTLTNTLNYIKNLSGNNGSWVALNTVVHYSKASNIVTVKGSSSGGTSLSAGTWNNLGTLPSGYRPSGEDVYFTAFDRNGMKPLMGRISTGGTVSLYCEAGQSGNYWLYSVSFPVVGGGN